MSLARRALDPALGRRRLQPAYLALHRLALAGMNFGPGTPEASGELHALRLLAAAWQGRRPLVVDAGANVGDWALHALETLQPRALHCFEPSPSAQRLLEPRLADTVAVVHPFALGDEDGEAPIYGDAPASGLASLHERRVAHHGLRLEEQASVRIRRLDAFCAAEGIERIDLLKLDVEGSELAALQGAGELLENGAIEAIQFEFGGAAIDARVFFQDFFYLLDARYRIFRILRDGLLPIASYREHDEIFVTVNYLCVARSSSILGSLGR